MKSKGKLLSQSVKSLEVTTKKCAFEQKKKKEDREKERKRKRKRNRNKRKNILTMYLCVCDGVYSIIMFVLVFVLERFFFFFVDVY